MPTPSLFSTDILALTAPENISIFVLSHIYVSQNTANIIIIIIIIIQTKLHEERRLRVFENKMLRRISGPRRDEVTGDWRRLHNEEINVLYCSPNIVGVIKWRRMRWAGHVARMGEERGVYRVLVGKPEGKRPLGWT